MSSLVSEKFHVHSARQFIESLSEGVRYPTATLSVASGNIVMTTSNVFGELRTGDRIIAAHQLKVVTAISANGMQFQIDSEFSGPLTNEMFTIQSAVADYDTYYLFIGRPTPWANVTPVEPTDSIANTTFDYWRDMIALRRVNADDVVHLARRYNWNTDVKYGMYDHRLDTNDLLANDAAPCYVVTSNFEVFKCLDNGRLNAQADPSESTSEPTTVGQSDITALTYAAGTPRNYVWKYLYTIPETDRLKYMTNAYIPVRSPWTTLDSNGDVLNDDSGGYYVFDSARKASNGAIYRIVVQTPGFGYDADPTPPPTVTIIGDGQGAEAVADVSSSQIVAINMTSLGQNYSWATVVIDPPPANTGSVTATATAIISPRNQYKNTSGVFYATNHGVSLEEELNAKYVMLQVQLEGRDENNLVPVNNEYRRVGLVRNPVIRDTNAVATANVYSQTTDLVLAAPPDTPFLADELVYQADSGAYGVFVEYDITQTVLRLCGVVGDFIPNSSVIGVGNGETAGQGIGGGQTIPATPEPFSTVVPASGATAQVLAVQLPEVMPYSGDILYVDQRAPVVRSPNQVEILRTVLTF